jgi:hypothetical protein
MKTFLLSAALGITAAVVANPSLLDLFWWLRK